MQANRFADMGIGVPKGGCGDNTLVKIYTATTDGPIAIGDLCEFVNGKVRKTYATPNGKEVNPQVISLSSLASGGTGRFLIRGVARGLANLTPNATYYCDAYGNLSTTASNFKVGVALSKSELLVKKPWWERGL